jgi:hypothetical protein
MGSIAVTALVAFVVVLLALVALRVAARKHWHPIDRIADIFVWGPSLPAPASSPASLPASSVVFDVGSADEE